MPCGETAEGDSQLHGHRSPGAPVKAEQQTAMVAEEPFPTPQGLAQTRDGLFAGEMVVSGTLEQRHHSTKRALRENRSELSLEPAETRTGSALYLDDAGRLEKGS